MTWAAWSKGGQEVSNFGEFFAFESIALVTSRSSTHCISLSRSSVSGAPWRSFTVTIDTDGYLVANGDFVRAIGPAFTNDRVRAESIEPLVRSWPSSRRHRRSITPRRRCVVSSAKFPTHWSFLLGETFLYSFVVLADHRRVFDAVFDPSMVDVTTTVPINRCGASNVAPTSRAGHFLQCAVACSCARSITGPL